MKKKNKSGSAPSPKEISSCQVKAVITIDERGQMVLPKELRDEMGITAGDKLAVISMASKGEVCCLSLMKVDELSDAVRNKLGPVLDEIKGSEKSKKE